MKALEHEHDDTRRAKTQHRVRGRGNGEGSVYQRSDGTWCAAVPVPNGKRRVLYGRTRQEVAQKLNTAQAGIQKGVPLPAGRLTLAKYLDQWLEQAARPTLKATTFRSYQELVRLHITPGLGRNTLAGLQPQQVQAFLNERSSTGLSPRRVQYIHAVLRVALNRAVKWQLIHRNVALLAEPPRGSAGEISPLTPEQASALLLEARGHRYEHLYSFLLASGLRLGEALALRWEDVDEEAGQLTVRHTLEKLPRTPWCLTEPKSKTGRRTIPLIAPAAAAVRAQRARNRENKMHAGPAWQELNFVFSDALGQPFSGHAVYSAFKHIAKRAGLPSTQRPHDLRHSTATYLLAAGVPTQVVMVILGHSSIVVTQRYGHVLNPMMLDAATRLEGVFSGIQTAV